MVSNAEDDGSVVIVSVTPVWLLNSKVVASHEPEAARVQCI